MPVQEVLHSKQNMKHFYAQAIGNNSHNNLAGKFGSVGINLRNSIHCPNLRLGVDNFNLHTI